MIRAREFAVVSALLVMVHGCGSAQREGRTNLQPVDPLRLTAEAQKTPDGITVLAHVENVSGDPVYFAAAEPDVPGELPFLYSYDSETLLVLYALVPEPKHVTNELKPRALAFRRLRPSQTIDLKIDIPSRCYEHRAYGADAPDIDDSATTNGYVWRDISEVRLGLAYVDQSTVNACAAYMEATKPGLSAELNTTDGIVLNEFMDVFPQDLDDQPQLSSGFRGILENDAVGQRIAVTSLQRVAGATVPVTGIKMLARSQERP